MQIQVASVIMMSRPTWDEYFLQMAELASTRSVCFRSHCGAVIVKDNNVISTGYNGAPAHQDNCAEIGFCFRNKNDIKSGTQLEKCRAVGCHSETNAIALAAKHGHSTMDATMYVFGNTKICAMCKGLIANCGIKRVVYKNENGEIQATMVIGEWRIHPVDGNRVDISRKMVSICIDEPKQK